ncbi:hypothetical protein [Paraburkholderia fungorum]|uniref:Uncharacterized protein n=1 Tax=Paraburkholderia fungorum TaxID=134537 RepID=A0A3R7GU12_9BURK|nr:hypothetical protein [Paraburkholderia fungorum]RKF46720.1 hypothetical protein BCY88_03735 [Paraburkholderia fungorum]
MATIATDERGAAVVDHIASVLSKKNKAQVAAINNALNFSFPLFRSRPGNANDLIGLRRAAMLIARTIDTGGAPARGGVPYESWDEMQLDAYIATYRRAPNIFAPPTGTPGIYLAGSFWAHATEDERSKAIAGFREAVELCTYGLVAANHAIRIESGLSSASGNGIYFDILRMWFGDGSISTTKNNVTKTITIAESVKTVLQHTWNGLKGNYVRLGYARRNPSESNFMELGFGSNGACANIKASDDDEYAYVNASNNTRPNNRIVLGKLFFDSLTTITLPAQIVAIDDDVMQVTRGGGVLHEATHLYAATEDVKLGRAAYNNLNMKLPADSNKNQKSYGTHYCLALARTDSAGAVKNADSYRIFCELAKHQWQQAAGRG